MGVIAWIVLGAAAGFIAEHLTGKRTGLLLATVIGIIGALLGGFLAKHGPRVIAFATGAAATLGIGNPKLLSFIAKFFGV